jgi:hypothetical protein
MMEEKILIVKPEQKFRHKENGTVYIVKIIKGREVLLVSDDGKVAMLAQLDILTSPEFEPIYD